MSGQRNVTSTDRNVPRRIGGTSNTPNKTEYVLHD